MSIYSANTYRELIAARLDELKSSGNKVTYRSLAAAMRVQPPYLSKVMGGQADLSTDQLFVACQELQLRAVECDFALLLLERERSTVRKRQRELDRKITSVRAKHQQTGSHLRITGAEADHRYYLDPTLQLLHIALSVPRFSANIDLLAGPLGLDKTQLYKKANLLVELGLATREGKKYLFNKPDLHLDPSSDLFPAHNKLLRLKTAEQLDRVPPGNKYNLAITFSADEDCQVKIRDLFTGFLKEADAAIAAAPCQSLYQMNFDLFDWLTAD